MPLSYAEKIAEAVLKKLIEHPKSGWLEMDEGIKIIAAALREYAKQENKCQLEHQEMETIRTAALEECADEIRSYIFEKGLSVEFLDLANRIETLSRKAGG